MRQMNTEKANFGALPSWDLSMLFSGKNDPRIEETFQNAQKQADDFRRLWQGKITDSAAAADILPALQEYESIMQDALKPLLFASLLHSANVLDPDHGALMQKAQVTLTEIQNKLLFLELSLLALSDEVLQRLISSAELSNYKHYLTNLLKTKPHRLSEDKEQMLNDFAVTGASAFMRLFEEEFSHKKFWLTVDGAEQDYTEEQVLNFLYDADREKRKRGADALTAGLTEDLRRLTFIFNILGEDKRIRDKYQQFATPESARHLVNETTQEMVDIMSGAVTMHRDLVADYYNLKREVLGLEELYDYDRYAPIGETQRVYSFGEARTVALAAYGKFSPVMEERAREFFEKNWIDAETRHGKRSGAFCSFMTPDTHPVVFLNYLGNSRSVRTLAHELGHGVHSSLMRKQTLLNFDTPLTIAETASVFGEMLVFDSLRTDMRGRELLALLMGMIEDIFATVFRQHAMYKFEQDFHTAHRTKGELKLEDISELWIKRQREMFGDSVMLCADYRIWWSYIPHFLHTPFYVYAYTFGELLTLSFYDMYLKTSDKTAFAERYVSMLEAGGTKTPEELLEPFGIDLSKKEFWEGGFAVVKNLVEEVKELWRSGC